MIEINLIPAKLKKEKQMQLIGTLTVLGAAAIIAVLLFLLWNQTQTIASIDREIKKIDAESASLTDKIAEVNRFEAMQAVFEKKKQILDKLLYEQSIWARILDLLADTILPDMWINRFLFDKAKDEGIVLVLEGSAPSRVILADFLKRLEENPDVIELKAISVSDNIRYGQGVADFNISFTFKVKKDGR